MAGAGRRRTSRRPTDLASAAVAVWLALSGAAAPHAAAHATLARSSPADGARLSAAPMRVSLTFSEPVHATVGDVRIVDLTGRRVERCCASPAATDPARLVVALRRGAGRGSYLVLYAVSSDDGHVARGVVRFAVGEAALPSSSGAVSRTLAAGHALGWAYTLLRWFAFGGLVLLGGVAVAWTIWPRMRAHTRLARMLRAGWLVCVLAGAGSLVAYGPYSGRADGWSVGGLADTLSVPYGRLLLLRLLAATVIAVAFGKLLAQHAGMGERERARMENVCLAAALALLLSFSGAGHSADDGVPLLTLMADLAHVGAMALWLGGLLVLLAAPSGAGAPPGADAAIQRFSTLAAWLVGTIAATGVWLASRTVGTPDALWTSEYGHVLLAKTAIVGLLLLTAGRARHAVWRRPGTLPDRTLKGELTIAVLVLGLTSVLISLPPGT